MLKSDTVQRRKRNKEASDGTDPLSDELSDPLQAASDLGGGDRLPFLATIQSSFGEDHDVSDVRAHTGGGAKSKADAIGAEAYATGNDVVFGKTPDLHTAAHEAAHVRQQAAGVQLLGGFGQAGDRYEQHADAVADAVVAGQSAGELLSNGPSGGAAGSSAIQRKGADVGKTVPVVVDGATSRSNIAADANGMTRYNFLRNRAYTFKLAVSTLLDGATTQTGVAPDGSPFEWTSFNAGQIGEPGDEVSGDVFQTSGVNITGAGSGAFVLGATKDSQDPTRMVDTKSITVTAANNGLLNILRLSSGLNHRRPALGALDARGWSVLCRVETGGAVAQTDSRRAEVYYVSLDGIEQRAKSAIKSIALGLRTAAVGSETSLSDGSYVMESGETSKVSRETFGQAINETQTRFVSTWAKTPANEAMAKLQRQLTASWTHADQSDKKNRTFIRPSLSIAKVGSAASKQINDGAIDLGTGAMLVANALTEQLIAGIDLSFIPDPREFDAKGKKLKTPRTRDELSPAEERVLAFRDRLHSRMTTALKTYMLYSGGSDKDAMHKPKQKNSDALKGRAQFTISEAAKAKNPGRPSTRPSTGAGANKTTNREGEVTHGGGLYR